MIFVSPWPSLEHRRLITKNSRERVAAWYQSVSALERYNGSVALLAIGDGTWVERYLWVQDFERPNRFHVLVSSSIVITIRLYKEYPGHFSVDRIGPA
jgi:hypothetical protein